MAAEILQASPNIKREALEKCSAECALMRSSEVAVSVDDNIPKLSLGTPKHSQNRIQKLP